MFLPALPIVDAAPPGDATVMATYGLALQVVGAVAALPFPGLSTFVNACRGPALADGNRRQACERAADTLVDRSDDLMTRTVAARIKTELSGSTARYDLQRAEMQAYVDSQYRATSLVDALGCKSIRATLDQLRQQALHGEVGAVRRWVAQAGLTPKDLLDRSRVFEARMAAAGASAVEATLAEAAAEAASMPASAP